MHDYGLFCINFPENPIAKLHDDRHTPCPEIFVQIYDVGELSRVFFVELYSPKSVAQCMR